ncbi:protein kinase [Streptosporangium sp. NBC_01495]|uniref:serine/threonine protein kinase n=1 Tax=Streptosporangium sp. NBC_01495 TaxID=2903899 RepID=UPI002E314A89|nr:protein kinase [Streptosporangium sp. NBC_01495]
MTEPLTEEDPPRLGSFELIGRLGEGGQGIVYLGRGPGGEQVAVKLLHHGLTGDPEARARFLREVSVAQRVARFCTAAVLHADLAGSRPYIVSEYVPGPSLRLLVDREGPRRGASLERLAVSTATALSAIHRAGILHRDFKPANVLMGPEGPVVIDFGIARALDSPGMTATGVAMGTPSYFAPEQLGSDEVTPAADVFAWGVTMVFAATGTPAFGQDSIAVVINRILHAQPELGTLEGPLRDLIAASLSKDPALRPTAEQLVSHLMGAGPTTPVPRPAAPFPGPGQASGPVPGSSHTLGPFHAPGTGVGPTSGTVSGIGIGHTTVPGTGTTARQGGHGVHGQAGPPANGPGQGGPWPSRPEQGGSGQNSQGPGETKAPRPVGLLLTGVAVVAALGMAAGAVVLLQDDEKVAAAAPAVSEVAEPEPTLVPDALEESPEPSETASERAEDTEVVSSITPPPSRRTGQPSSRPAGDPVPAAEKPTRKPSRSPSQTPEPTVTTAEPTPPAKPTASTRPSTTPKPSSSPKPTSKPTTAKPTVKPTAQPSQKPNPYTATGVCGSGYKVVDSRALGSAATVYLLYNTGEGKNCVVTMSKYVFPSKIAMNAILQVKGGSSGSNPGSFTVYAGPIRLPAAKKCVIWGGSHGSLSWKSGWSHCG